MRGCCVGAVGPSLERGGGRGGGGGGGRTRGHVSWSGEPMGGHLVVPNTGLYIENRVRQRKLHGFQMRTAQHFKLDT